MIKSQKWRIILSISLILIIALFSLQNYQVVEINFLFFSFLTSRAIVVLFTLIAGILIGLLLSKMKR
ncbi:MAG: putative integral membrane protein [Candidatus Omnitrophota bacterium]|jgi:uncharacterized integral membrane protein